MGLLTDDKSSEESGIVKLLRNHANKVSFLCFTSAIIVAAALVTENYVDTTYFSDNALLPGLVNREFTNQPYLKDVLTRLRKVAKSRPNELVADWLVNEFNSIGLHGYEHNFTLHYPFGKEQVSFRYFR